MRDAVVRASPWAGVFAPVVVLGAILLATLASPTFVWAGDALSNLGGATDPAATAMTRALFNGGLFAGGIVGLLFGPALLRATRNRVETLGAGGFGLTLVAMALIGLVPQDQPGHLAVAAAFYLLLTLSLLTYGLGNVVAGRRARGLATLVGGLVTVGAWVVWAATGPVARPGLALPEIVGAAIFGAWAVATGVDVRRRLPG